MEVMRVVKDARYWNALIDFAENCSWIAGKHIANMVRENRFSDWECIFAAIEGGEIIGYCTLLKTDYYPENRYSPWVSALFVAEKHRGRRVSQKLIDFACAEAKRLGFTKVYTPSDMVGFYEKYGYVKIDELINYGGDMDSVFMREI